MNLGFSFAQHMRLSSVKRWTIIEMTRAQSVAEHSYNVATIAMAVVNELSGKIEDSGFDLYKTKFMILEWALLHDLPELVTGDLPSPVKDQVRGEIEALEEHLFPEYGVMKRGYKGSIVDGIVKTADWIDAIQFAQRFCIDPNKEDILREMSYKLDDHMVDFTKKFGLPVRQAVEAVWTDEKIPSKNT